MSRLPVLLSAGPQILSLLVIVALFVPSALDADPKRRTVSPSRNKRHKIKKKPRRARRAGKHGPLCVGTYANDLAVLTARARLLEARSRYTFCLRSTAVYQCLYYSPDGRVKKKKETASVHGTAFAFRKEGKLTYLLTNEHVVGWPAVTTAEVKVDGVPAGCKRVSQTLAIVENEKDSYARDDVALQRVVVDPELDVAILKAPLKMAAIPFTLGQSAALQGGEAVLVRGFPLGAFRAVSTGKVSTPHDHDQEGRWDHVDVVIDAPLSAGNSGSPVLAVSCRSRRLELVGVYHAAYREGQGLNVAVGIDELRELVTTLRPRSKKKHRQVRLGLSHRRQVLAWLGGKAVTPMIPFGGHTVGLRVAGQRLLWDVYPRGFPLSGWRRVVMEDWPAARTFGRVGRLWFGGDSGLRLRTFTELKPGEQHLVSVTLEMMRRHLLRVLCHRREQPLSRKSRARHERLRALERHMARDRNQQRARLKALLELAARHAPGQAERGQPAEVTVKPPRKDDVKGPPLTKK